MEKVVNKWRNLPDEIVKKILLLVIKISLLGFFKCNTYQSFIQTLNRFEIKKKKGKHFLLQIDLDSTDSIPWPDSIARLELVLEKHHYYLNQQVVSPNRSHNTQIENGSLMVYFLPRSISRALSNKYFWENKNSKHLILGILQLQRRYVLRFTYKNILLSDTAWINENLMDTA